MATENVTQLLWHFPFNTHVIVYSLDNNLVLQVLKDVCRSIQSRGKDYPLRNGKSIRTGYKSG